MADQADELTPEQPLWQWAEHAISHRAEEMLKHADGVREGADIEAVHDMRVGSRRVVAAMRVFHAAFPGGRFKKLMREARDVTRRLGEVRDLDVLIDHFQKQELSGQYARVATEYLLLVFCRQRDQARKPMLKSLGELEKSDYQDRLRKFLREEETYYHDAEAGEDEREHDEDHGDGRTPFREAAPTLMRERLREYQEQGRFADQPEATEELHALRIKAKWLRYTMELFAPAYPDELKDEIKSVKRIQELLGNLHDSDVRLQLLEEALAKPLEARALVELALWLPDPVQAGLRELHAAEVEERKGTYRAFYKEWKKDRLRDFETRIGNGVATPRKGEEPSTHSDSANGAARPRSRASRAASH